MSKLDQLFEKVQAKFSDLKILSLTTADGFSIYCYVDRRLDVEDEKVAAVSSSLISSGLTSMNFPIVLRNQLTMQSWNTPKMPLLCRFRLVGLTSGLGPHCGRHCQKPRREIAK